MDSNKSRTLQIGMALAAVWIALGLASVARADIVVITPVGATASSFLGGTPRTPAETINNDGLQFATPATITSTADLPNHDESSDPLVSPAHTPPHGGMWLTDNTSVGDATGKGTEGWIVFDLGAPTTINTVYVWNYAEEAFAISDTPTDSSNRGAKAVSIYADNSPITPSLTVVNGPITSNGSVFVESTIFAKAPDDTQTTTNVGGGGGWNLNYNTPVVAYTLPTSITAQYIEFAITSNWGASDFVGLSEVRFAEVPEPSAALLLGLGAIGVLTRRRKLAA